MTKARAKTLVSELIERGYSPTVSTRGDEYMVSVTRDLNISPATLTQVETLLTVTASVRVVDFT